MAKNFYDSDKRMSGALSVLEEEFSSLRTGRAHPSILENLMIDAYGNNTPLKHLASILVSDARLLTVQVWDVSLASAVEKAILESELGLNPIREKQFIRVPIPQLSGQRRIELTKIAGKAAESARVAVRNIRRDIMDRIRSAQKDKKISEDEYHSSADKLQKITDEFIGKINSMLSSKEKELIEI